MTPQEKRAGRLVRKWQKRLGLDDWAITSHVVAIADLDPDTVGNVSWDENEQTANVWLWCGLDDAEMEYFIVHEMVHIVLDGETATPGYCVLRERKIAKLTRALLRQKHK